MTPYTTTDCCAQAESLPFNHSTFSVAVSQETLEHVKEPWLALREIHRVLKHGGILYFQVPFILGYHPGPTDFWRFSKEGIRELVERAGFVCEEVGIAVGPATGFYRISVEFVAILISRFFPYLYTLSKASAAIFLYPIKWLDRFLLNIEQNDRIAGGYYAIAKKYD
jgi:SAM-dependent methyltransferase